VGIPYGAFVDGAARKLLARLEAAAVPPTPSALDEFLRRTALADLCLALACEAGIPAAWEAFTRVYAPQIRWMALGKGASGPEASAIADELPGALACPPARGGVRTRLGTFDGTGSLRAWLRTIVGCAVADLRRAPRRASLEALLLTEERGEVRAGSCCDVGVADDPQRTVGEAEIDRRIEEEIRRGGQSLSPRERLALVLRFRDGLPQAEIGRILGVGTPRACRILKSAVAKLGASLRARGGFVEEAAAEGRWGALRDAVAVYLSGGSSPARGEGEGTSDRG
jgi:RNA polymerase sigma factor (sigma-70 family)